MSTYGFDRKWPFAQGGGNTILVATGILVIATLFRILLPGSISSIFLLLVFIIWLTTLYFFRDPNRVVVAEDGLVLSPGDGVIVEIVREREERYLKADVIRISQFLSITDVHVQRVPLAGKVVLVQHQPGRFLQAFRPEASEVNEHVAMRLESEYGSILVKQIAGILARRCVNYLRSGDQVLTGQRFGLIRFGSRIDLFIPPNAEVLIQVGDKALGGLSPIARMPTGNGR